MKKWIVVSVNAILEVVIIFCFEFTYRIYWGDYLAGDFGGGLIFAFLGWGFALVGLLLTPLCVFLSIWSIAKFKNTSENKEMLQFARNRLNDAQFMKLSQSCRRFVFVTLSVPILVFVLVPLFMLVPFRYLPGLIVGLLAWLILSRFMAGSLWREYVKLYKSDGISLEHELQRLFQ